MTPHGLLKNSAEGLNPIAPELTAQLIGRPFEGIRSVGGAVLLSFSGGMFHAITAVALHVALPVGHHTPPTSDEIAAGEKTQTLVVRTHDGALPAQVEAEALSSDIADFLRGLTVLNVENLKSPTCLGFRLQFVGGASLEVTPEYGAVAFRAPKVN